MAKKKYEAVPQSITWESVRLELNCTRTEQGQIDYDRVRRGKLAALAAHTKRPAVLYAADFLNETKLRHIQNAVAISPEDVRGLAEVVRGLDADSVDLILHSPGGSPEAAESIVAVLRARFKTVRVLVPVMAKSAATMIALSANEILMPLSAELGPIDPQFLLSDGRGGQRMTPAQAIIDDVQRAQQAVATQQPDAPVWLMQVQGQPPGLYQQALNAVQLSKQLVKGWLENYMFAGDPNAAATAQSIVDYLGDHNRFLSHARRVDIKALADLGAKVYNITDVDRQLWQLLEELWYTVEHTFHGSAVFKMWENSKGIGLFQVMKPHMILTPAPEVYAAPAGKDDQRLAWAYRRLAATVRSLAKVQIVDFDEPAIRRYEHLRKLKLKVRKMDLRIAATVLERDATLVTCNVRDFRQVPGLRIEDWSK